MRRFLSVMLIVFLVTFPLAYGQTIVITPARGPVLESFFPQIVGGAQYITVVTSEKVKKTSVDTQIGYDWAIDGSMSQPLKVGHTVILADQPIPSGPFGNELIAYGYVNNITSVNFGDVVVDVLNSTTGALAVGYLKLNEPINEWNVSTTKVRIILRECSSSGCKDISAPLPSVYESRRADFFAAGSFGLAIANPNDQTATVVFTLESGEKVPLSLSPHGHVSAYMWQLFPKMEKTSLRTERFLLDSDRPVAVQPLEEKKDPIDGIVKYYAVPVATAKDNQ